jgi:hypothetical protein
MRRQKLPILLLLSMAFLTQVAMTCDDDPELVYEDRPCNLADVQLFHWNNAGEKPGLVLNKRAPKVAYMLEIRLLTDEGGDTLYFPPTGREPIRRYYLPDPIERLQIYALRLPEEGSIVNEMETTEVTDWMFDYPKSVGKHWQLKDKTSKGISIREVHLDKNSLYKALLTPLPAGDYRFKVQLSTEGGEGLSVLSDTITLY